MNGHFPKALKRFSSSLEEKGENMTWLEFAIGIGDEFRLIGNNRADMLAAAEAVLKSGGDGFYQVHRYHNGDNTGFITYSELPPHSVVAISEELRRYNGSEEVSMVYLEML